MVYRARRASLQVPSMAALGGDSDTVHGLSGRLRLQRDTALGIDSGTKTTNQKLRDGSWMDVGRQYIQAYEYLCHVGEAKQWIESCLGTEVAPISMFEEALRDGVILANLTKQFRPDLVKKIFQDPKLQFRHSDNVNYFFAFLHAVSLPELFIFELIDLYDGKNIPKVIYCLHALSHLLAKRGMAPRIKDLVGELNFTEEELIDKQNDIENAGVAIPSFRGIDKKLANEMEPLQPLPELSEAEKSELWRAENVDTIAGVQAMARGALVRKKLKEKKQFWSDHEDQITLCQAVWRARGPRKQYKKWRDYWRNSEVQAKLVTCQAVWRGRQARLRHEKWQNYWHDPNTLDSLTQAQALWRGRQARRVYDERKRHLVENEDEVIKIQAAWRGYKQRQQYQSRRAFLNAQEEPALKIQAWYKGLRTARNFNHLNAPNPPAKAVHDFIHLLEEDDNDWMEEVEIQSTKQTVVRKIRENLQTEDLLNELDIKIALLVKNRVGLDVLSSLAKKIRKRAVGGASPPQSQGDLESSGITPLSYLKALDADSRKRLGNYQNMFYLLQTDPSYLTKLFFISRSWSSEVVKRFVEVCVPSLFSFGQYEREEYLLLKLFANCIHYESQDAASVHDFIRGNPTFIKLVVQYNRGAKERKFLRDILGPALDKVFEFDGELEIDPVNIYKTIIREEEVRTGTRSEKPFEVTTEVALHDGETRHRFLLNLQYLRNFVELFLNSIISSLDNMPYGIRYIAKELREALHSTFPQENEGVIMRVIGNLLYYRYTNPAIIAPDVFDVCEVSISPIQRKNLSAISKLLHSISVSRIFSTAEPHLVPLNDYLSHAIKRFHTFLSAAIRVPSLEEKFHVDSFSEAVMTNKPVIYISPEEIFSIHSTILDNSDDICGDESDPMRVILSELGSPPVFGTQQARDAEKTRPQLHGGGAEIALKLTNRFMKKDEDASKAQTRQLFLQTKNMIIMVLRIQHSGAHLVDMLTKDIDEAEERRYQQLLKQDDLKRRKRRMKSVSVSSMMSKAAQQDSGATLLGDTQLETRRPESYLLLKRTCLENLSTLEGLGVVSVSNYYQDILNDIARDITGKNQRRSQRNREIAKLQDTLDNVNDKARFLEEQVQSYQEYINACVANMTASKRSSKKTVLPFTRQYFHNRELQRSGKIPQFGSYRYTARHLYDKGVLVEIVADNVTQKMYDRINLTISSNEPGVFDVEATFAAGLGMAIAGDKCTVRLEELLQYQFNNVQTMDLMDCAVVNVNLLIYLLNKKFFS